MSPAPLLQRRLGSTEAVALGVGSMVGAGIYAALAPAAAAAGAWLPAALALVAVVAWCNAQSSARLAALYPQAGGTYVYATRRLGPSWGHLAGGSFIVGKLASCAAMALTVGAYAWPEQARATAVAAVVALTAVSVGGVQRGARLTVALVVASLAVLALVVVAGFTAAPSGGAGSPAVPVSPYGVLQGAGLLFFAFAGYARLATLGEEVRDPARTIPRAITAALLVALLVYAAVAAAALVALGPGDLAASATPLSDVVRAAGWSAAVPVVAAGAVLASGGALLGLLLGVSRTAFAMARDGHLPSACARVHARTGVPWVAETAAAVVVIAVVAVADVRGAIGFSSVCVLAYYLLANASAATLSRAQGRPPRWVPTVGAVGCAVLVASLPWRSVLAGAVVLVAVWVAGRFTLREPRRHDPA